MKLDAALDDEANTEGIEADPGLGRRIDNPGKADEEGWKKAENGYPCEYDSVVSCSG